MSATAHISDDELKRRWELLGGTLVVKQYSKNRISKFYYTKHGNKFDSWVKAKHWLTDTYPEVLEEEFNPAEVEDVAPPPKPRKTGGPRKKKPVAKTDLDDDEFEDEDSAPKKVQRGTKKKRKSVLDSPQSSVEILSDSEGKAKKEKKGDEEDGDDASGDEGADSYSPSSSDFVDSEDSDYVPEKAKSKKGKGRAQTPQPDLTKLKRKSGQKADNPPAKKQRQQAPPSAKPGTAAGAQFPFHFPGAHPFQARPQAPPQQQPQYYPSAGEYPGQGYPGQTVYQSQAGVQPPAAGVQQPAAQPGVGSNTWQQSVAAAAAAIAANLASNVHVPVNETSHAAGTRLYKAGQYAAAEAKYTDAIKEMEAKPEEAKNVPVMYGNRAAARLKQSNVDGAMADNQHSLTLDPNYAKAYTRIADCYLRSGDFDKAKQELTQAMEKLQHLEDKKAELEQKMTQIKELEKTRVKFLQDVHKDMSNEQLTKIMTDAKTLIDQLADSEPIRVAVAVAHLRQMQFDKCLEFCSQQSTVPWQWWLALQVKYHQGDLPEAIQMASSKPDFPQTSLDSTAALGVTMPPAADLSSTVEQMQQLLKLKEEGNTAINAKQAQTAVDKYNAALALRPPVGYAAVLYSNRSRAYESLDNPLEALADSGRAKALKPSYSKPYLRLATQLTEFRRANEAVAVLQELQEKVPEGSKEHWDAGALLVDTRIKAPHLKTPDHYKFLCLKSGCTDDDVRRAYKRRALAYHPDKAVGACKYTLQMGENGLPLLSSDLHARLKKEANNLFTHIGEANDQLSDATKRKNVDIKLQYEAGASQNAVAKAKATAHMQQAANQARSTTTMWTTFVSHVSTNRSHPNPTYAAPQPTSQPAATAHAAPRPAQASAAYGASGQAHASYGTTAQGYGATAQGYGATTQGYGATGQAHAGAASQPRSTFYTATQGTGVHGQPPAAFFGQGANGANGTYNPFGPAAGPRPQTFYSNPMQQNGAWQPHS